MPDPRPPEHGGTPEAGAPDTAALLQRILVAVERDRRRGALELVLAIILSLATLGSTWCGYQSQRWGSVESGSQAAADTAERKAAEDTIVGLQLRTFDGLVVSEYWSAIRAGDTSSQTAILTRIRPQLRRALEASLAAGVLENPDEPGPLQRPEYVLAEEVEARRFREEAERLKVEARKAGTTAGGYVILTLMFASVLFFGGITCTFSSRRVRIGLASVALGLFLTTVVLLARLPVSAG